MPRSIAWPIVGILVVSSGVVAAAPKERESQRAVWVGLSPGPLAGSRAHEMEARLVEALESRDSFRVIDAAGTPLDARLFGSDLARMTKLFDEGIDLLLNLKAKKAVPKFDEAIELFHAKLAPRPNHDLLHDALLARAEALFQLGRATAAAETLRTLAALAPVREPTRKTHPPKFVALWEKSKAELGAPGRLVLLPTPEGGTAMIDGRPYAASATSPAVLAPGKHLVTMRWPSFTHIEKVTVESGRTTEVAMAPAGPGATARRALLDVADAGGGVGDAKAAAARLGALASANEVWVAAIRGDALIVVRHDAEGAVRAAVRVPISAEISRTLLGRAVEVLFDDPPGEHALVGGRAEKAEGLADLAYAPVAEEPSKPVEPTLAVRTEVPKPEPWVRAPSAPLTPPPGSEPEEHGITGTWWFWTTIGVAVVGAALVGGLALRPEARSTRVELVLTEDGS